MCFEDFFRKVLRFTLYQFLLCLRLFRYYSIYLSSFYLPSYLFHTFLPIYLSIYLSSCLIYPSINLSFYPSIFLNSLFLSLSDNSSVYLTDLYSYAIHVFISLFAFMSLFLHICLSSCISFMLIRDK